MTAWRRNRSKFNSKKVELDGIVFDSIKEARKYAELKLLMKAGEVVDLELQPEYVLLPEFVAADGKKIRPIKYRADFKVVYQDGRTEVIDTKGYRTREYLLKKKLFLSQYPWIDFVEE